MSSLEITIKSNRVHYRTGTKNTIWNLYRIDYRIVHELDNKGLNMKINPNTHKQSIEASLKICINHKSSFFRPLITFTWTCTRTSAIHVEMVIRSTLS